MKKIYQFGLIRSGTNYTRAFLTANFDVIIKNYDVYAEKQPWKHGALSADSDIPCVLTVRNPYSWLYAVYRYDYKNKYSFEDWIFYNYSNRERQMPYIPLWSFANYYWLNHGCEAIRFEDLLQRPDKVFKKLPFKKKVTECVVPQKRVDPKKSKDDDHNKTVADREKHKWFMNNYSTGMVDYINKCLDKNLMKEFEYA